MLDSNHPVNFSSPTLKRAMPQETEAIELQTVQPTSTSNTTSTHHGIQGDETILPTARPQPKVRQSQAILVILQLSAIKCLTSMSSGLMTVSMPRIAADLAIQPHLYFW